MVSNSFPSQSGHYFYEPVMQASAIPYEVTEEGIRVCLIATQSKKRWVFPKASLEGRCSREVAIRAAREEAGVSGRISEKPVGRYKRLKGSCLYLVEVFPLEVTAYLRGWREIGERQRRWVVVNGSGVDGVDSVGSVGSVSGGSFHDGLADSASTEA